MIAVAGFAKNSVSPYLQCSEDLASSATNWWWDSKEVTRILPEGRTMAQFFNRLRQFQLERKRLLDTLLAATFRNAGIERVITNNGKNFRLFPEIEIVEFR